ncbi:hypothetical protein K438DRAFT_1748732 [Mycena galopus ATCC 62051]|nr:hypothetical protein K438DRAFT_1748732 [Mycena galopus ATCC 62051]
MDDFPSNRFGDPLVPVWSLQDHIAFLSLLGAPSDIPANAVKYIGSSPVLLLKTTPRSVLQDFDYVKCPVWYNPSEHWLGWVPTGKLSYPLVDPVEFLFDNSPPSITEEYADIYGYDSESSDSSRPTRMSAGHLIDIGWMDRLMPVAMRLHDIAVSFASSSSWYCHPGDGAIAGELPEPIDGEWLKVSHWMERDTLDASETARRACLSLLGFLAWFQTLADVDAALSSENTEYLRALELDCPVRH